MAHMRRYPLAMMVACFAMAGCGKAKPALAEVEGTVKFRGKPLPGVTVQFIPDAPKDNVVGVLCPSSMGVTDDQGHYHLTCAVPRVPGALVGSHHVTILDPDQFDDAPRGGSPGDAVPKQKRQRKSKKEQLDLKYMMPAQTPLAADVRSGGPQVIDFNVK